MSACSNYLEKKILDHALGIAAYTPPVALYIGLFKATVSDNTTLANLEAGTITDEVSGNGYARKPVTFSPTDNTTGLAQNSATVTFDEATGSWGTISQVAIMDALTDGNVLFYGSVTVPKQIDLGDTFQITTNSLKITLS